MRSQASLGSRGGVSRAFLHLLKRPSRWGRSGLAFLQRSRLSAPVRQVLSNACCFPVMFLPVFSFFLSSVRWEITSVTHLNAMNQSVRLKINRFKTRGGAKGTTSAWILMRPLAGLRSLGENVPRISRNRKKMFIARLRGGKRKIVTGNSTWPSWKTFRGIIMLM